MSPAGHAPGVKVEADFAAWLPNFLQTRFKLAFRPATKARSEHGFDLVFSMTEGAQERLVFVDVKSRWLRANMPAICGEFRALRERYPSAVPILAVPSLSLRIRKELREAAINHVDLAGALYVREPGLYIDTDPIGDPSNLIEDAPDGWLASTTSGMINPFSDTASVVLRLLLNDPDKSWRIHDLADAGGMSPGWVTTVARTLERRGYATRSQRGSGRDSDLRIADAVAALQDWTDAYTWRANHVTSYNVPFEYHELVQRISALTDSMRTGASEFPVALTLHSGADLYAAHVQHEQLHLYVQADSFVALNALVRMKLHGQPAERSGNLHLLQPHYRRSVFVGASMRDGLPVVSAVQLYLDLVNYPLRGKEAADALARVVLGPAWQLSSEQLRRLLA